MPMDAAVFAALAVEFNQALGDARLERVWQVDPRELSLILRPGGPTASRSEVALVLSVDGALARVACAPPGRRNPAAPTPFSLLLRRHLEGCRLAEVRHPAWERILTFVFLGPPDEFPRRRLTLVYELLGVQANILLLDAQELLLGALRPLPRPDRDSRLALGLPYLPPPKAPAYPGAPLSYLRQALGLAAPTAPLRTVLLRNVGGLSPWAATALIREAGLDAESPAAALSAAEVGSLHACLETFAAAVTDSCFTPCLFSDGDDWREFWVYPVTPRPGWKASPVTSTNEAISRFFAGRVAAARFEGRRQSLGQRLGALTGRLERRLAAQRSDLARAEAADAHRRAGELILAHLPELRRGDTFLAGRLYGEAEEFTVPLDPRLSPSENAQRYFARYRKAKRGKEEAASRVAATEALLGQTRLALLELEDARTTADLEALAETFAADGLLDAPAPAKARPPQRPAPGPATPARSAPRRYLAAGGYEILAGRNSRENDWLTLRTGAPQDLWLHVKDLAGAHVILRLPAGSLVPDEALLDAAQVAAYHSEGRQSSGVPVDYTFRRHVRKAPGGGPGQVLYDHHRTLYVTPDPDRIARLRAGSPLPEAGEP